MRTLDSLDVLSCKLLLYSYYLGNNGMSSVLMKYLDMDFAPRKPF